MYTIGAPQFFVRRPVSGNSKKRKASALSSDRDGKLIETAVDGPFARLAEDILQELDKDVRDDTIYLCGSSFLRIIRGNPDAVLDLAHRKLHTWPYQSVPSCWRRLYEEASLVKVVHLFRALARAQALDVMPKRHLGESENIESLRLADGVPHEQHNHSPRLTPDNPHWLRDVVTTLDMGITLSGAPGRSSLFQSIFDQLKLLQPPDPPEHVPDHFSLASPFVLRTPHGIPRAKRVLSLQSFQHHLDTSTTPLIIPDAVTDWPATSLWNQPRYLYSQTLSGHRLVPVEIGSSYTESDWGQKMMPFRDFLTTYLCAPTPSPNEAKGVPSGNKTGYLAQHDLFAQIPHLRKDIRTPDYCYSCPPTSTSTTPDSARETDEPLLNAWLGPAGTKTPLHTDPYHNILCQVVGYKYLRLCPPFEAEKLYPMGTDENGVGMENTAQVDVQLVRRLELPGRETGDGAGEESGQREGDGDNEMNVAREEQEKRYPLFAKADYMEGILGPGECVYIPSGWWHYVESLSVSFSVSFWWN